MFGYWNISLRLTWALFGGRWDCNRLLAKLYDCWCRQDPLLQKADSPPDCLYQRHPSWWIFRICLFNSQISEEDDAFLKMAKMTKLSLCVNVPCGESRVQGCVRKSEFTMILQKLVTTNRNLSRDSKLASWHKNKQKTNKQTKAATQDALNTSGH